MKVELMMSCESVTLSESGTNPKLRCVARGKHEKYFKFTPWGELSFGTINPSAAKIFEPGATYRVVIEREES